MNKVTMEDVEKAMNGEVILAEHANFDTHSSKDLKMHVYKGSLKFRVRHYDKETQNSAEYFTLRDAIAKYNEWEL